MRSLLALTLRTAQCTMIAQCAALLDANPAEEWTGQGYMMDNNIKRSKNGAEKQIVLVMHVRM